MPAWSVQINILLLLSVYNYFPFGSQKALSSDAVVSITDMCEMWRIIICIISGLCAVL